MKCSSFHAVRWSLILFAMTAAASTVARAALPTLKVGSDAPPIAVAK